MPLYICDIPIETILVQNKPNKNLFYNHYHSIRINGTYPPAQWITVSFSDNP